MFGLLTFGLRFGLGTASPSTGQHEGAEYDSTMGWVVCVMGGGLHLGGGETNLGGDGRVTARTHVLHIFTSTQQLLN